MYQERSWYYILVLHFPKIEKMEGTEGLKSTGHWLRGEQVLNLS